MQNLITAPPTNPCYASPSKVFLVQLAFYHLESAEWTTTDIETWVVILKINLESFQDRINPTKRFP